MRVLIADDEKCFATTLAALVTSSGHEVVDIVHSGLEAIRSYQRNRPDVVLMDFNMAKLNGLTACRNILSSDPAGRIVFLSGIDYAADLAPPSSGAVASLQKPIRLDQLQEVLEKVVPDAPPESAG